jgi:hypothetical protein
MQRIVQPLNFSTANKPRKTEVRSTIIELKGAVSLVHDFFYYLLFDFDIKMVINSVPLKIEGLIKIYTANLKSKAADQLKIIYYARN